MLRRLIAVALLILVSVVVVPCGSATGHVRTGHAAIGHSEPGHMGDHACCEPTSVASHPDCCSSITPHPATAPDSAEHLPGMLIEHPAGVLAVDRLPIQSRMWNAMPPVPAMPPPALVLRT